jgi:hypothetical protein
LPVCRAFSIFAAKNACAATDNEQNPLIDRTLTVNSSNPGSGAAISIDKIDKNGHSNGATPFTRTYNNNTFIKQSVSTFPSRPLLPIPPFHPAPRWPVNGAQAGIAIPYTTWDVTWKSSCWTRHPEHSIRSPSLTAIFTRAIAPPTTGTRAFLRWLLGGADYSNDKSITFAMNEDKTFTAVFSQQSGNKYRYIAKKIFGAQNAPVIDGNLNDAAWSGAEEAVLARGGTSDAFSTPWSSFTDNRVTWKAVWCEETNKLYAAIQVTDDVKGAADNDSDSPSYQPWLDDSIELYTDGDCDGGPYSYGTAQQWRITTKNRKNLYNYPIEGTHSYSGVDCITAVQTGGAGTGLAKPNWRSTTNSTGRGKFYLRTASWVGTSGTMIRTTGP